MVGRLTLRQERAAQSEQGLMFQVWGSTQGRRTFWEEVEDLDKVKELENEKEAEEEEEEEEEEEKKRKEGEENDRDVGEAFLEEEGEEVEEVEEEDEEQTFLLL
jgi:hypothetical protein